MKTAAETPGRHPRSNDAVPGLASPDAGVTAEGARLRDGSPRPLAVRAAQDRTSRHWEGSSRRDQPGGLHGWSSKPDEHPYCGWRSTQIAVHVPASSMGSGGPLVGFHWALPLRTSAKPRIIEQTAHRR